MVDVDKYFRSWAVLVIDREGLPWMCHANPHVFKSHAEALVAAKNQADRTVGTTFAVAEVIMTTIVKTEARTEQVVSDIAKAAQAVDKARGS